MSREKVSNLFIYFFRVYCAGCIFPVVSPVNPRMTYLDMRKNRIRVLVYTFPIASPVNPRMTYLDMRKNRKLSLLACVIFFLLGFLLG